MGEPRARATTAPTTAGAAAIGSALLAHLPGLTWATDAALRCQVVSPAAAEALGLTVGGTAGAAPPNGHPDDFAEAHRRALAGQTAHATLQRGNASFDCRLEPLRDAGGSVIGVLGSAAAPARRDAVAVVVGDQLAVLAAALEDAPVAIVVFDVSNRVLYSNATARALAGRDIEGTGLAEAAAVWGEWYDDSGVVPPEQWPVQRALRGERVPAVEFYTISPQGRYEWFLLSAAPLRDAAGAVIGAAGTAVSITARRQAEARQQELNQELERRVAERTAALEEAIAARDQEATERREAMELLSRSTQLLRDIVDNSPAVIFVKDLDGRYRLINREHERLLQISSADWIGRTDDEMFPPEVAQTLQANNRLVLAAGKAMRIEEVVPAGGREYTYLSVKFPLRDSHGAVYGVCGIATDITEQKELERALRRSEATLASIIESSSLPICAVDRDREVVAMNRASQELLAELIGGVPAPGPLHDQVPAALVAPWQALIERGLGGERFTVERTLTTDGSPRYFLVSFNPTVQDGAVTGVALFGREITDLRHAEEEMRHHQAELAHALRLQTMGEIAASLAHEVNQPLGAIANYAQGARNRLRAGSIGGAEVLEAVEAITREALRAGEITRRVRELLHKEEAQRVPADAGEIARAALAILASTASRAQVALTACIDERSLPVVVDPIQIEQVVVNLMLNAIEAIGDRPGTRAVEVHATLADGPAPEVTIAVSDSGPGVDPAHAARIFEPFLTTKTAGLGMGLAISRSIVAAHGGRLWHTPTPGGGATFHFTLPTASDA